MSHDSVVSKKERGWNSKANNLRAMNTGYLLAIIALWAIEIAPGGVIWIFLFSGLVIGKPPTIVPVVIAFVVSFVLNMASLDAERIVKSPRDHAPSEVRRAKRVKKFDFYSDLVGFGMYLGIYTPYIENFKNHPWPLQILSVVVTLATLAGVSYVGWHAESMILGFADKKDRNKEAIKVIRNERVPEFQRPNFYGNNSGSSFVRTDLSAALGFFRQARAGLRSLWNQRFRRTPQEKPPYRQPMQQYSDPEGSNFARKVRYDKEIFQDSAKTLKDLREKESENFSSQDMTSAKNCFLRITERAMTDKDLTYLRGLDNKQFVDWVSVWYKLYDFVDRPAIAQCKK